MDNNCASVSRIMVQVAAPTPQVYIFEKSHPRRAVRVLANSDYSDIEFVTAVVCIAAHKRYAEVK